MEKPINIFVEGIADEKFIQDYVSHLLNIELSKNDIIKSEGWTNINSKKGKGELIINKMISNSDNGGLNIIIFDSDSDYEKRRKEILKWGVDNSVEFQLFLFPNNSLPGALEDLLEKIINKNTDKKILTEILRIPKINFNILHEYNELKNKKVNIDFKTKKFYRINAILPQTAKAVGKE